ncbi:sulfoxide reductase catalytic subunit YedY, partial [Halomonas sp. SUBG004]
LNSWQQIAADEYGFYANVNPRGRPPPAGARPPSGDCPNSLFNTNTIDTLMFNGYADEVAELYAGMDLRKHY